MGAASEIDPGRFEAYSFNQLTRPRLLIQNRTRFEFSLVFECSYALRHVGSFDVFEWYELTGSCTVLLKTWGAW